MTQTKPRKTSLTTMITKMRKKKCLVCVWIVEILARGKMQLTSKNKHGRIYTSTLPNKTIPCFLLCLFDFLVVGTVLMG